MTNILRAAAAIALLALGCVCASAADRVWVGGFNPDTRWSQPTNWEGGVLPTAGDTLVFHDSNLYVRSFSASVVNDLGPIVFGGIRRLTETNWNGTDLYVEGNGVILGGPVPVDLIGDGGLRFWVPVRLAASDARIRTSASSFKGLLGFDADVTVAPGTLTIEAGSNVAFRGRLIEEGRLSLLKTGSGTLELRQTNELGGTITVLKGELRTAGLGSPAAGTEMRHDFPGYSYGLTLTQQLPAKEVDEVGDALRLHAVVRASPYDALYGMAIEGAPLTRLLGPIFVQGEVMIDARSGVAIEGPVSGAAILHLRNTYNTWDRVGYITLSNPGNDYSGETVIDGPVHLVRSEVIPDASALRMTGYGKLHMNRTGMETVQSLRCVGGSEINITPLHSELRVTQSGSELSNCVLKLIVPAGETPAGDVVLIRNLSGAPIPGQFVDLPEGAALAVGTRLMYVTYKGGPAGVDVMLVGRQPAQPPPPPVVFACVPVDFDGDCDTDVLMRAPSGALEFYLASSGSWGAGLGQGAFHFPSGSSWVPTQVGDFDGDGKADLLLEHPDGRAYIWLMRGDAIREARLVTRPGPGYTAVKVGDFNGDGRMDVLWRDTATGAVMMRIMNGFATAEEAALLPAGTAWRPAFIADFLGDGTDDILWVRDDGRVYLWLMDGTALKGAGFMTPPAAGQMPYKIADFDGDGVADVLWRSPGGSVGIRLATGVQAALMPEGSTWDPRRIGDFNGDGRADILWYRTGSSYMWLMNGAALMSAAPLPYPGGGWTPEVIGDFNRDGKSDILWRSTLGEFRVTIMDGSAVVNTSSPYVNPGYAPIFPAP